MAAPWPRSTSDARPALQHALRTRVGLLTVPAAAPMRCSLAKNQPRCRPARSVAVGAGGVRQPGWLGGGAARCARPAPAGSCTQAADSRTSPSCCDIRRQPRLRCRLSCCLQGYRARTRYMFQRPFRGKGYIPLSTYLTSFKVGDYVDIKVNGAVHKVRPSGATRRVVVVVVRGRRQRRGQRWWLQRWAPGGPAEHTGTHWGRQAARGKRTQSAGRQRAPAARGQAYAGLCCKECAVQLPGERRSRRGGAGWRSRGGAAQWGGGPALPDGMANVCERLLHALPPLCRACPTSTTRARPARCGT